MKSLYGNLKNFSKISKLATKHPKERVRKKNLSRLKRNFNTHSALILKGKVVPSKVKKQIMEKPIKE